MKWIFKGAALCFMAVGLIGCDSGNDMPDAHSDFQEVTVSVNQEVEEFNRLSYEGKVHAASALLVVRYEHGENGEIVPVVTHRKSRLGAYKPPYQVGDVYMSPSQQFLIEMAGDEPRHLEEGAIILFQGEPPRESTNSFISNGSISGEEPVPVEAVLAGFDGSPIANARPAEVLTLEPDLSNGETGPVKVKVNAEEKAILVEILERRNLRYEVIPQDDEYVVGWVGMEEEIDRVFDEFDVACE